MLKQIERIEQGLQSAHSAISQSGVEVRKNVRTHFTSLFLPLSIIPVSLLLLISMEKFFNDRRAGQVIDKFTNVQRIVAKIDGNTFLKIFIELPIVLVVLLLIYALYRGIRTARYIELCIAAVTVMAANVSTQILKKVIFHRANLDDAKINFNGFPSGHTTIVLSCVILVLLFIPPKHLMRCLQYSFVTVVAISYLLILGGFHRGSDIAGAYLVCLCWIVFALVWYRLASPIAFKKQFTLLSDAYSKFNWRLARGYIVWSLGIAGTNIIIFALMYRFLAFGFGWTVALSALIAFPALLLPMYGLLMYLVRFLLTQLEETAP